MILTSIGGISVPADGVEDADVVRELCAGKTDAFETLFSRYVRLVFRVTAGILKDRGEAEDVTQEIFLEIYRKAYLYDPARGSVRTWLLQYAYHRALRRKTSLERRAAYRGEPVDAADTGGREDRPRLTPDECRWVLRAGLAQLPQRQRTTLELTCFEELTLKDVAERLGVSIGCTRHYYYRGLARLKAWAGVADGHVAGPRKATRVSRRAITAGGHGASAADRAGGGTGRDRLRCVRI